jgi:hypothetical protein
VAAPQPAGSTGVAGRRPDLVAVLVLAAVPVFVFALPAALGHPNLPGDDGLQNFPLRVLAGRQLAHGVLPTFDPYIWSGAPLLGGWNAGALSPFTMLFAFLPAGLAWVFNEMAVYWAGALGLYAFLRVLGLRPVPSFLGAATFAFAGALDTQLAHFGVVAGTSWLPLALVALAKLDRAKTWRHALGWVVLLGVVGAMCVLAGEPRAIDTVLIVVLADFGWLLVRRRGHRLGFAVGSAAGVGLAVLLSAVQWIPGAIAVSTSQRAMGAYALYSAGSLNPHWLTLFFVPGLLGGSGAFGTSPWFATYSLSEVMGYAGILALTAACGLLGTLHRRRPLPDWLLWEGVAVVGIVLALGGNTPLGHLLVHVPVFGDQRLQSRNIAITDLALAVLLGYWVEEVLVRRAAGRARTRWPLDRLQACSLLPVAVAAGLAVAALATPAGIAHLVGATVDQATHSTADRPLFAITLVVCAAAAWSIVSLARLSLRGRRFAILALATVDLATFNVAALWPLASSTSLRPTVSPAPAGTLTSALGRLASRIGTSGRYAIYNPLHLQEVHYAPIQVPDTNLYEGRSSVQGYSSIVDAAYAAATGSHAANGAGLMTLSPAAVTNGTLADLDTTTLITLPAYLLTPASSSAATESGSQALRRAMSLRWFFGETLRVGAVTLRVSSATRLAGLTATRVGLVSTDGSLRWPEWRVGVREGSLTLSLSHRVPAAGVVVEANGPNETVTAPIVRAGGATYAVDGPLAGALSSGWSFAGDLGAYAYFSTLRPEPPLRLAPLPGGSTRGATVRAAGGPILEPTLASVSSPHGVVVVRAVSNIPGWRASWRASSGITRALSVRARGVVQEVDVPAGRGVLSFSYDAPGVALGVVLTLVGLALLAAVLLVALAAAWRRRGWRSRSPSETPLSTRPGGGTQRT